MALSLTENMDPTRELKDLLEWAESKQVCFISPKSLADLMQEQWVRRALKHYAIEFQDVDELASIILQQARKVFGILILADSVELLGKFYSHGILHDDKLPLEESMLGLLFPENGDTRAKSHHGDILKEQWKFLAPSFSPSVLHQEFRDELILPFIKNDHIGRGSFGDVYRIEIHRDYLPHHSSEDIPLPLARKEIQGAQSKEEHRNEHEILSKLQCLKHPNILKLLGSYTQHKKQNLIFPFAENGNLEKMLTSTRNASPFGNNEDFLVALTGLASALSDLHNFEAPDKFGTPQLSGYHHDLHPRNILISQKSFILADFGLSRLKRRGQNSSTWPKRGQDDYVAPECQDWENDLQMSRVHRSAEIWSFGCILTEILAFMLGDSTCIDQFRADREVPTAIPCLTTSTAFYCGGNQINPHVCKFLQDISTSDYMLASLDPFLALIKDMLLLEPKKRPTAKQVASRMSFIALLEISSDISDHIMRIGNRNDSLGVTLERLRFDGWRYATGLLPENRGLVCQQQQSYHREFDRTKNLLLDLRAEVKEQESLAQPRLQFSGMSLVIDRLHELLSPQEHALAENHFDDQLYGHKALDTYDPSDARLESKHKLRLKLRAMTECLDMDRLDDGPSMLKLDARTIEVESSFEDHSLGFLDVDNAIKSQVFIEWRQIKGVSADPANTGGDKLSRHTCRLARLLSTEKPEGLLVLHCRGYFIGKRRATAPLTPALAFDFPSGTGQPTTLHKVMSACKSLSDHPVLEDKFKLAHSLAMTVYEFQRLGWVHKRLSPANIVFFVDEKGKSAAAQDLVQRPYVVGFSHSRPDDPNAFTDFPDEPSKLYCHPVYAKKKRDYLAAYDYYSLGLILYEIGLWRCISESKSLRGLDAEELRKELLNNRLTDLTKTMGTNYYDIVKICLAGDWTQETSGGGDVCYDFGTRVVCKLLEAYQSFVPSS